MSFTNNKECPKLISRPSLPLEINKPSSINFDKCKSCFISAINTNVKNNCHVCCQNELCDKCSIDQIHDNITCKNCDSKQNDLSTLTSLNGSFQINDNNKKYNNNNDNNDDNKKPIFSPNNTKKSDEITIKLDTSKTNILRNDSDQFRSLFIESNDKKILKCDHFSDENISNKHNIITRELCEDKTAKNHKGQLDESLISSVKIKRRLPSTPFDLNNFEKEIQMSTLNVKNSGSQHSSNLSIPTIDKNDLIKKSAENLSVSLKPKLENVTEWLNKSFDQTKSESCSISKSSNELFVQKQQRSNSIAHVRVVPDEPLIEINLNRSFYNSKQSISAADEAQNNLKLTAAFSKSQNAVFYSDEISSKRSQSSNNSRRTSFGPQLSVVDSDGFVENHKIPDEPIEHNHSTRRTSKEVLQKLIEKSMFQNEEYENKTRRSSTPNSNEFYLNQNGNFFEQDSETLRKNSLANSKKLTKQPALNYINEDNHSDKNFRNSFKSKKVNDYENRYGEGRGFRELSVKRKDPLTPNKDVVIGDPALLYVLNKNDKKKIDQNSVEQSHLNRKKSEGQFLDFTRNTVSVTRASSQPPNLPIDTNLKKDESTFEISNQTSSKTNSPVDSKNINLARFRSSSPYRKNSNVSDTPCSNNSTQNDVKIKINNNESENIYRRESNKSNSNDTGFSSLSEKVTIATSNHENQLTRQLSGSSSHSNSNKDDSDSVYSFNSSAKDSARKHSANINENKNLLNLPEHNYVNSTCETLSNTNSKQSKTITDTEPANSPFGDLQVQLAHSEEDQQIVVKILRAKNLIAKDANGFSDPFVKVYLLPGREQENKRRTKHVLKNLNPEWNFTVVYPNVHKEELKYKTLEFTIWDWDRFKSNDFLGIVKIELNDSSCLDNKPRWYSVKNPTFNQDSAVQDWSNSKDQKLNRQKSVKAKKN